MRVLVLTLCIMLAGCASTKYNQVDVHPDPALIEIYNHAQNESMCNDVKVIVDSSVIMLDNAAFIASNDEYSQLKDETHNLGNTISNLLYDARYGRINEKICKGYLDLISNIIEDLIIKRELVFDEHLLS